MAVANEQALGDLHAQRAELVHQQSAVQEQAPEDAPAVRARGLAPRQRVGGAKAAPRARCPRTATAVYKECAPHLAADCCDAGTHATEDGGGAC